jgi:hypothetical protein
MKLEDVPKLRSSYKDEIEKLDRAKQPRLRPHYETKNIKDVEWWFIVNATMYKFIEKSEIVLKLYLFNYFKI